MAGAIIARAGPAEVADQRGAQKMRACAVVRSDFDPRRAARHRRRRRWLLPTIIVSRAGGADHAARTTPRAAAKV
jgi:hypothetical protein